MSPEFFSADVAAARRFYLDLKPPRNRPLVVVCGGLEHCTPDYAVRRDTFPFYSIEYVACGSGELKLKDQIHTLQPGGLFSYGPGIPHQITGNAKDPLVKYFVDFTGTKAVNLLDVCKLTSESVSKVFPANALQSLFDEIINAGLQMHNGSATLCNKLLECLALKINGTCAPVEGANTLAFATYQQCHLFIEKHFLRLRTLEQIARECHVNSAYLCRLFQRYDPQTPYQYLLKLKMNHASERLQQTGVLIKQVAEETGFADPFHFSRVFAKVFGLSPSHFSNLRK